MSATSRKGAEEARNQLPDLLEAAEKGRSTIITKHGRPVAVLVPLQDYDAKGGQQPLVPLWGPGEAFGAKIAPGRSAICVTNGTARSGRASGARVVAAGYAADCLLL